MYNDQNDIVTQTKTKPNIGFVGVGWIGLNRMNAMLKEDLLTVNWARQLAKGEGFNKEAYQFVKVAEVIDRIYKREV